eukprot:TRINITY_DN9992_c0_g2_i5.p1 TRINITY_DN9992_c0_g2~~TRINITY_DN9992_c0_g2_i5.p1  ORF type:complete len:835 (-),score=170.10 TRINITY_DN9992_c0_g2_i5:103-2607(-)
MEYVYKFITEKDWNENKWKLIVFPISFVLDLLFTLLLHGGVTQWNPNEWGFDNLGNFEGSASDTVVLCLFRMVLIPFILYHGSRVSSLKHNLAAKTNRTDSSLTEDLEADIMALENSKEKKEEEVKRKKKLQKITIGLIFIIITLSEIMMGVKAVLVRIQDQGKSYTFVAFMLGLSVLCMNLELWLSNTILLVLTREDGFFFPNVHSHPLYYSTDCVGHICDFCQSRGLREAYRCESCDYDLCVMCTKKTNKSGGEGLLRTDRGVKEDMDFSNWDYMRKALSYASPHAFVIVVALIFLMGSSLASLLVPSYQGSIFDDIIGGNRDMFKNDVIIFLVLNLVMGVMGAIRNFCFQISAQRMTYVLRHKLYECILKQDIAFFDGVPTGDLTSRLGNNTSSMVAPVQSLLSSLLSSLIQLVGGLVMCLWTSWRLALLAFTTIGPITLLFQEYSEWAAVISKSIWASIGDSYSLATQAFVNIRTVRAFGQEPLEISKYEVSIKQALDKGEEDAAANVLTYTLTEYIEMSISVLLLWYGGTVVFDEPDILSVGKLITFELYWNKMNASYQQITSIWNSFTRAGGAAQRVMALLELVPDIDTGNGKILQDMRGDITLRDVEFWYQMRPDEKVLQGVNLDIPAGSVCALVGKSGSGKTTLISLILRLYDTKGGCILIDGEDIRNINPLSYRQHIGIVSQDTELFNGTVEANIAYGVNSYTKEDLINAAKEANAHEFIMGFEEGYQTRVGERGTRLSGGQKQRVALARVFLRKPKLMLLDEATSALDAERDMEVTVVELIDSMDVRTRMVTFRRHANNTGCKENLIDDSGRLLWSPRQRDTQL